jgi:hypothetical protein
MLQAIYRKPLSDETSTQIHALVRVGLFLPCCCSRLTGEGDVHVNVVGNVNVAVSRSCHRCASIGDEARRT